MGGVNLALLSPGILSHSENTSSFSASRGNRTQQNIVYITTAKGVEDIFKRQERLPKEQHKLATAFPLQVSIPPPPVWRYSGIDSFLVGPMCFSSPWLLSKWWLWSNYQWRDEAVSPTTADGTILLVNRKERPMFTSSGLPIAEEPRLRPRPRQGALVRGKTQGHLD